MSGVLVAEGIYGETALGDDLVQLKLLGSFEVRHQSRPITLPLSTQRLIAFLALHDGALLRIYVAGSLWPNVSEERAAGNLRSSLWRLRQLQVELVEVTGTGLRLRAGVTVDLRAAISAIRLIMDGREQIDPPEVDDIALLADVLPDWYDDWVLLERERFRQMRLYALQTLCERLTRMGRFAEAMQAGLAAVAAEPLRESAQRALIRAHLAEGNVAEAVRRYRAYEKLLSDDLGLRPSPLMRKLVEELTITN